jgi:hypothetical protein
LKYHLGEIACTINNVNHIESDNDYPLDSPFNESKEKKSHSYS